MIANKLRNTLNNYSTSLLLYYLNILQKTNYLNMIFSIVDPFNLGLCGLSLHTTLIWGSTFTMMTIINRVSSLLFSTPFKVKNPLSK